MVTTLEETVDLSTGVLSFLRGTNVLGNRTLIETSDITLRDSTIIAMAREGDYEGIDEIANKKTTEGISALIGAYPVLKRETHIFYSTDLENLAETYVEIGGCGIDEDSREFFQDYLAVSTNDELRKDIAKRLMWNSGFKKNNMDIVKSYVDSIEDERFIAEAFDQFVKCYGYKYQKGDETASVTLDDFIHLIAKTKSTGPREKMVQEFVKNVSQTEWKDVPEENKPSDDEYLKFLKDLHRLDLIEAYTSAFTWETDNEDVRKFTRFGELMLRLSEENGYQLLDMCYAMAIGKGDRTLIEYIDKIYENGREHNLEIMLDIAREIIAEEHEGFDVSKIYEKCGLSLEQTQERVADALVKGQEWDRAIEIYGTLGKKEKQLEAIIGMAEKRSVELAFHKMGKIGISDIDTSQNSRFHKVIASSIMSLFIPRDLEPNLIELKKAYSSIKPGLVRDITVSREDGLEVYINLEGREVKFKERRIPGDYRNDIRIFEQEGLVPIRTALKFYGPEAGLDASVREELWLKHLEGKVPIQRLVGHGNFGHMPYNQIELCDGEPMKNADYDTLKKAIDISFDLYEHACRKKGCEMVQELTTEFIEERIRVAGYGRKHAEAIKKALDAESNGVVHNDYAPRNLMVKDGEVVVVDHECYVHGNPVYMAVTLIHNPDNNITQEQAGSLMEYARSKGKCSDAYVHAATVLWDCRQMRRLSKDSQEYNWFVEDLKREVSRR